MSRQHYDRARLRAIHECMLTLGTHIHASDHSPVRQWLLADLELLDSLRQLLATATRLDEHALISQPKLQDALEALDASIGAKSVALDLLGPPRHYQEV